MRVHSRETINFPGVRPYSIITVDFRKHESQCEIGERIRQGTDSKVASTPRRGTFARLAQSHYSSCSWAGFLSRSAECIDGCYFETLKPVFT